MITPTDHPLLQLALSRKYSSQHRLSVIDLDDGFFAIFPLGEIFPSFIGPGYQLPEALAKTARPQPLPSATERRKILGENLLKDLGL